MEWVNIFPKTRNNHFDDSSAQTADTWTKESIIELIKKKSDRPALVIAQVATESSFNNDAVGLAGERGILQWKEESYTLETGKTYDNNIPTVLKEYNTVMISRLKKVKYRPKDSSYKFSVDDMVILAKHNGGPACTDKKDWWLRSDLRKYFSAVNRWYQE